MALHYCAQSPIYTGWDKSRLTAVRVENKTLINNNIKVNCVL